MNILKYNYRELERLAVKGNNEQKEWLWNFLHVRNDKALKESLPKFFKGARP